MSEEFNFDYVDPLMVKVLAKSLSLIHKDKQLAFNLYDCLNPDEYEFMVRFLKQHFIKKFDLDKPTIK